MILDAKLGGKSILRKKRDELNIKLRKIHFLLGRNSELSMHNKSILCKQVIRPVWSYGIQLWGCASNSNNRFNATKTKCWSVLLTHHGTFETMTFILISESRRLQISSLSSPTLMERDFMTTSTSKRPDLSTWTISPDDSNGRNRLY
jgi:hypothetical protein